jgi:pilus assembly protein CpaF
MVTMAGFNLPIRATRAQIAAAIHVVVQLERLEDGKRKVVSLQEVQGMEGDVITMSEIFKFQRQGVDREGNVQGHFQSTGLVPKFHEHLQQRGIHLDFSLFNPSHRM